MYIDGKSFNMANRAIGLVVDYDRIRRFFLRTTRLVHLNYYTVIPDEGEYSSIKPLTEYLAHNGYLVTTRSAKLLTDAGGAVRLPGNMDVEIALDMRDMAERVDHIVLVANSGSMQRAIDGVQRLGARVTVIAAGGNAFSRLSPEVRRQADEFVELEDMRDEFEERHPADPASPQP